MAVVKLIEPMPVGRMVEVADRHTLASTPTLVWLFEVTWAGAVWRRRDTAFPGKERIHGRCTFDDGAPGHQGTRLRPSFGHRRRGLAGGPCSGQGSGRSLSAISFAPRTGSGALVGRGAAHRT